MDGIMGFFIIFSSVLQLNICTRTVLPSGLGEEGLDPVTVGLGNE